MVGLEPSSRSGVLEECRECRAIVMKGDGVQTPLHKGDSILGGEGACLMRYAAWTLISAVDVVYCSLETRESVSLTFNPDGQVIVVPFMFKGYNIAALPTTKFGDLKKDTKQIENVVSFLRSDICYAVWEFLVSSVQYKDDDRFERLFDERMRGYLRNISEGTSKVYMRGNKTFSELLEMVCGRMLECSGRVAGGGGIVRYGRDVMRMLDDMIENPPAGMSEEEKKVYLEDWRSAKEWGEFLYSIERWERIAEVEKIVCNACKEICLGLREEELLGLLAEGGMKKTLKEEFSEDKAKDARYLEYIVVDDVLLLDAHREYGGEVTKELVRQMLLGKEGKDIDKRYVDRVAGVVRERQRKREEETERSVKELVGDEEKAKSKKKGKKKSVGVSEAKEEEKKESGTEEVEASEEVGIPSVEVGGARRKTGKKSKGDQKRFKIHSRVLRWRKSPEKIKKEWDRGSEERWKGRSLEEIKEQKIVHDITGVLELLRSEDADRFFMDAGKYTKGGSERQRMVAIGALETGGQRMTGVVEVGTFKDGDGCPVVYHLRFKPTSIGSIGDVINPGVVEASDVGRVDEGEECEDADKFVYPKGVRFETVKETGSFQIVWKNPSDTSEVLRRLIVYCRPCVI
ncbi:DUF1609 domain-containing protein [Encephalitozoon cuniculi]|nr:DUF1609 domain-containing protein [Encephalitozoon cuniculi]UYI27355.1 DUF1609 domain-containing protein [Encephalitozoon cuniculi]